MQEGHGRENEEQTASRPSVAKLAGMFKGSSPPPASETLQEKPVRRRPPRSLQLPKSHGDEHERPSGVTSPVKAKRNSALIEKLQANLALSPANLLPSPKSPGFRLLPPFSPPSSPSPTAGTPSPTLTSPSSISTSLVTEEEGPVSFEAPPTAAEGSLLMNVNKVSQIVAVFSPLVDQAELATLSGDALRPAATGSPATERKWTRPVRRQTHPRANRIRKRHKEQAGMTSVMRIEII
ncbi:duboraya isoform X2 [Hippocampus zosterae]|uniref:duboraya isoform X2 n=1 Tax=Hippocampus zosterae TaxID=109293 RepID=UPI00223CFD9B|nr:duboraya isoform X2 [Hippocampus zosterae]